MHNSCIEQDVHMIVRSQVGGVELAVCIDCDEFTLQRNLTQRAARADRVDDSLQAIGRRIAAFKENGLPILAHLDDMGKLQVVSAHCIRVLCTYAYCSLQPSSTPVLLVHVCFLHAVMFCH